VGVIWGPHGFGWIDDYSSSDAIDKHDGDSWRGRCGPLAMPSWIGHGRRGAVPRGMPGYDHGDIGQSSADHYCRRLAYTVLQVDSITSVLAVACAFGPTSVGIALNILHPSGVLETPLGQLIVAIAIIDDIIALVILSQLQALNAVTVSVTPIHFPIVSALLSLAEGLPFMPCRV
jgi:Sodium/hydrogen exchanger family